MGLLGLSAREYVAEKSAGDRDACIRMRHELAEVLRGLGSKIEGFHVRVLLNADDIEDEDLDEGLILEASKDRLPVVWVNVTFYPDQLGAAELTVLEERFSLRLTGSIVE